MVFINFLIFLLITITFLSQNQACRTINLQDDRCYKSTIYGFESLSFLLRHKTILRDHRFSLAHSIMQWSWNGCLQLIWSLTFSSKADCKYFLIIKYFILFISHEGNKERLSLLSSSTIFLVTCLFTSFLICYFPLIYSLLSLLYDASIIKRIN